MIDKYLISAIGVVVLVYPWWRLKQISSEFNMMEQRIQNAASEIDNYMEQRVVILSNAAKLVEKSIEVDKDILVDIAKYRSGNFSEESRSDVNAQLNKATRALKCSYRKLSRIAKPRYNSRCNATKLLFAKRNYCS